MLEAESDDQQVVEAMLSSAFEVSSRVPDSRYFKAICISCFQSEIVATSAHASLTGNDKEEKMGSSYYFKLLVEGILEKSDSKTFMEAKNEWTFKNLFNDGEWSECVCTHPIKDNCVIYNFFNGEELIVGNCCIKQFLDLDFEPVFKNLRSLRKNPESASCRPPLIHYCYDHDVINEWESRFLLSISGKRKFTEKQSGVRKRIHSKISRYFSNRYQ